MTKEQVRQVFELIQKVNSQKVQHTAEMKDLKLVHAIQTKELLKEKNSSAVRFPPQGGQTLSGTDPIQFLIHKVVHPSKTARLPDTATTFYFLFLPCLLVVPFFQILFFILPFFQFIYLFLFYSQHGIAYSNP